MHEHLTHAIYYTEIHLIFCSIVWLAAWALTSIPELDLVGDEKNRMTVPKDWPDVLA
jgi:hypothetical protein